MGIGEDAEASCLVYFKLLAQTVLRGKTQETSK
jgi:hypothetical protein